MTPNETNPVPTESRCSGGLIVCKKNSKKEGMTLFDHLKENHPELFTKEHEAMFSRPTPTPEVGNWERKLNAILWDNITIEPGKQKDGSYSIPLKQAAQEKIAELVRSLLSSQASAFQKKIGEAVDSVVASLSEKPCRYGCKNNTTGSECYGFFHKQAAGTCVCQCHDYINTVHAAADRIKKENL